MKNTIYIISGPLGVGKSTTSKELANIKPNTVRLEADHLYLALEDIVEWKTRMKITWNNIVYIIKEYLDHDLDVVLDFIIEDELDWFKKQFEDYDVNIKYVVLYASEDVITERLEKRNDSRYLEKSLKLRNSLLERKENKDYLLDISELDTEEIIEKIDFLIPFLI